MGSPDSSAAFLITGCDIVLPDRVVAQGAVLVDQGRILFAGDSAGLPKRLPDGCRCIQAEGMLATPALWEMHIHGCGGISTERMTEDSLTGMAAFLAEHGVGAFLPTIVPLEETMTALGEALDSASPETSSRIPGIHIEGPFVAPTHRGAIPPELLRQPSAEYLLRMIELTRRRIRTLTIAPELEGAPELIARLSDLGILPSLGHSDAAFEELDAMDRVEPLSVTHLFNGMSGVSHKSPGLAQWALLNKRVHTELNCDGTHVHDAAVRLTLQCRPWDKVIAISDAVAPAGLPPEQPLGHLYGKPLEAKGSGLFYSDSGVLVGSRFLIMDEIARLITHFDLPVHDAVAMATRNPATLLGFSTKGALLAGFDADISLFAPDFSACYLLCWGGALIHGGDLLA